MPDPTALHPRLSLDSVCKRFGSVSVVEDVTVSVAPGEIVCLLGPSGCGKSTTLRMAAGVERQDRGAVAIDGRVVSDGRGHLPPERRGVGLMFQDFALFPHLTVAENVAFGLAGRDRIARAEAWLARVDLAGYGGKHPHMLSGGEQQRVALARAMAPNPGVMLMDEPFSGLDNRLRDEVRDAALAVLEAEGAGVLLVTHEPEEAMRMGSRIALMRHGRVVQVGSPWQVYNHPVDRIAAAFFSDINVIGGRVRDGQVETPFGRFLAPGRAEGATVEIVVRPQHIAIDRDEGRGPPPSSAHGGVAARGAVVRARFVGAHSLIEVRMDDGGDVLQAVAPGAWLPPKDAPLWLRLRRDRCHLFPRAAAPAAPDLSLAAE